MALVQWSPPFILSKDQYLLNRIHKSQTKTEDIHLAACNGIDLLLIRSPTTVLKNQKQQHGKVGVDEITEKLCFEKKLQGEVRSYVSQQRIFQVHVAV